VFYVSVWLLYMAGYFTTNVMLTSEFYRKTQLESELLAAQQIQRTLHPDRIEPVFGYALESYYRPFRGVGGDYFDVIDLGDRRTLLAVADVSGKGMPAALLASNIQALVRSMAGTEPDLATLAGRINRHLSRYTPSDRFATAMFIVLNPDSGELLYVNAGHNPAMICGSGPTKFLEGTGFPLGLFPAANYQVGAAAMNPADMLLLFTDGLPDSIPGEDPEDRLRAALTGDPVTSIANLKRLVDPELNADDITILLVKRTPAEASLV
jgi:sigma-B regulation protein RsbU (phosphoserine phosphatase)